jgi:hypothetical protein
VEHLDPLGENAEGVIRKHYAVCVALVDIIILMVKYDNGFIL